MGSNAVVTTSLPPGSVAVGAPARIIKQWDWEAKVWRKVLRAASDPSRVEPIPSLARPDLEPLPPLQGLVAGVCALFGGYLVGTVTGIISPNDYVYGLRFSFNEFFISPSQEHVHG